MAEITNIKGFTTIAIKNKETGELENHLAYSHEDAVFCNDGTSLPSKMTTINNKIDENANKIDILNTTVTNHITNHPSSGSSSELILLGKKMCVIGDSITYLYTPYSTKNYHDFIAEKTGCTVYNHGKNGWTIVQLCNEITNCESDSDIITLFAGTNDWHIGTIPLGEVTDTSKTVSVCGAIDEIFNLIINKFPTKTILVYTPLPRTNPNPTEWIGYKNDRGYTLEELVDKLILKCKQYSIPYLDLYRNSGIFVTNTTSRTTYFADKALHPNIVYHEILGKQKMLPFISRNLMFALSEVENTPPYIYVISNVTGVINADINITYTAGDSNGSVAKHEFSKDGGVSYTQISPSVNGNVYSFNTQFSTAGTYNLKIRCTDNDGASTVSNTFTAIVSNSTVSVTGVTLDKETTTVNVGSTDTLIATIAPSNATNQVVTWSSSDSAIATVSGGVVTGVANGTATITVTTDDGEHTDSCAVTVQTGTISVTAVSVSPTTATITTIGGTKQLTATISPSNATNQNVNWSSSNSAIATVDSTGKVTSVANGTCTITCTSSVDASKFGTCNVTVNNNSFNVIGKTFTSTSTATSLHIVPVIENVSLATGSTITIDYEFTNVSGFTGKTASLATFESTNNSVGGGTSNATVGSDVTGYKSIVTTIPSGTVTHTLTKATTAAFLKPFMQFAVSQGSSFTINKFEVLVNGVSVPVVNLGTYTAAEKFTLV